MKRAAFLIVLVGVFVLLVAGLAVAATPQDIYKDFADDGDLDGTYTEAELRAYLNDATVHQYGQPSIVSELDKRVRQLLTSRDDFPFTGSSSLVLVGVAVVVLLGGGLALRPKRT